MSNGSLLDVWT